MPIQGYTPNRNLIKIAPGSTDNWDVWYNQALDTLDEPAMIFEITAAVALNKGDVAVIKDDGAGAKKAYLADSATYTLGDPLGVAEETVAADNPVKLVMNGRVMSGGWAFGSADKFVYLSSTGTVTTAATQTMIGFVISATAIYFSLGSASATAGDTNTVAGANGVTNSGDNVDAVLEPVYGSTANTVCQGNDSRLHTQNSDGGTDATSFEINYLGDSAQLSTTGLTANRTFTFPDATTKLVGETSPASINITGGTIDGATIGGTTPAAGTFTELGVDKIKLNGDYFPVKFELSEGAITSAPFNGWADAFQSRPYSDVQYWDGAAWQTWAQSLDNLFDGNKNTSVIVPAAQAKFRFTVDVITFYNGGLLAIYREYSGGVPAGCVVTVEDSADKIAWTQSGQSTIPGTPDTRLPLMSILPDPGVKRYLRVTLDYGAITQSQKIVWVRAITSRLANGVPNGSPFTTNYGGGVGLGVTTPAASAALEVASTTGAVLMPRMTTTQRDALTAVNGMIVYNTTTNQMEGYINGAWTSM